MKISNLGNGIKEIEIHDNSLNVIKKFYKLNKRIIAIMEGMSILLLSTDLNELHSKSIIQNSNLQPVFVDQKDIEIHFKI